MALRVRHEQSEGPDTAEMRICLYLAWEEKIFLNIITTKC